MKIIFLSPGWPPAAYPNGIVTWISILREQLGRLGHEVYLVTMDAGSDSLEEGIYPLRQLQQKSLAARAGLRVAEGMFPGYRKYVQAPKNILATLDRVIDETAADLVVVEESFGWCGSIAGKLALPVVATLHGPWFLCSGDGKDLTAVDRKRIKAEGEGLRKVAAIASPSEYTLNSTRRLYGLQQEQMAVIPNPVKRAKPDDCWSLDKCDSNNILFVGRFDRLKGADMALQTFAALARDHQDLTLTFVGPDQGLQMDDGQLLSWDQYTARFLPPEIVSRITYTGRISPDQVAGFRRRSFVTLVCSRYETFPFTLLEALSLGCPVVATEVGGIPEVIQDGRNGLLAASGDVEGMTAKVLSLLQDRELAASLGRQGAEDCGQRYDAGEIALQMLDFFQAAIEQYGAASGSKGG